jgi:hypothetical protein
MSDFHPTDELVDCLNTIIKTHMDVILNELETIAPDGYFMECLAAVVSGATVTMLGSNAADPVRQANLVTIFNVHVAPMGYVLMPILREGERLQ